MEVSFRVVLACLESFCFSLSLLLRLFASFRVVLGHLRSPSKSFLVSLCLVLGRFDSFWFSLSLFLGSFGYL